MSNLLFDFNKDNKVTAADAVYFASSLIDNSKFNINLSRLDINLVPKIYLGIICHSPQNEPFFWGPYLENVRHYASLYNNQITLKTFRVGDLTEEEMAGLSGEIISENFDIIGITGVPKISQNILPFIISSGKPYFHFNFDDGSPIITRPSNNFGYVGSDDYSAGSLLAKRLMRDNNKRFAIVFLTEPGSLFPDGPLDIRSKNIQNEFGSNFIEKYIVPNYTFSSGDPMVDYLNGTEFQNDINYAASVTTANPLDFSEIVLIAVQPFYAQYLSTFQSNLDWVLFDTLSTVLNPGIGTPNGWTEVVLQNASEQCRGIINMSIHIANGGDKRYTFTGPHYGTDNPSSVQAASDNFELEFK